MTQKLSLAEQGHKDEVIQEVRSNRESYAAQYGYDVRAILRRTRERAEGMDVKVRKPRRLGLSKPS